MRLMLFNRTCTRFSRLPVGLSHSWIIGGQLYKSLGRHSRLEAVRERLSTDAQWWFRTCDTFGAEVGHAFAQRWADWFERPVW